MKTVGLRELKNRLSHYVRHVRSGQGFQVTDRGQVVAELLPPASSFARGGHHPGLLELARRGSLTLGAKNDPRLYPLQPRLLPPGMLRRIIDEMRGER